MTIRGKSINLFLMDGSVTGCIKCSLSNWTGIAYKIPRTELDNCKSRNDLKQRGSISCSANPIRPEKTWFISGKPAHEKMAKAS